MSYIEKERLIKADIESIENRVRHAFNQGYDLGFKEGKERAKPQEPTTKNDLGVDCVARHDVERFIEGFINEYTPEEELEFINLELDGLKHLPPATPQEQKIGHWTTVLHEEILFCSECHQRLVDEQTYISLHYCPNCGARMVEPQESEGT